MIAMNDLDPQKVHRQINANPNWWATEGEGRYYICIDERFGIIKGRYGVQMTVDEWRIFCKVITPEVLEAMKGILEDFDDMKRMDIKFLGSKYEV